MTRLLALAIAIATLPAAVKAQIAVTYVANEGVLLQHQDKRVLIDAIFQRYRNYASPDAPTLRMLESAGPPFEGVDLVLATHVHRDHFHPVSVAKHLENNPAAKLVSAQETINQVEVEAAKPSAIRGQFVPTTPGWRERIQKTENGVEIEVLGLRHAHQHFYGLQHVAYVVRLGGKTVLHLGDCEVSEENFAWLGTEKLEIDVAITGYWTLADDESRRVVKRFLNVKHFIAAHLPSDGTAEIVRELKRMDPSVEVFSKPGQSRTY